MSLGEEEALQLAAVADPFAAAWMTDVLGILAALDWPEFGAFYLAEAVTAVLRLGPLP